MSLLNRYILVRYNVGGPELWHERLALEHVSGEEYIIVTPDRDLYVEELSAANEDLLGVRVRARPARGVLPPGIAAGAVYPLPAWTAAELGVLRGEARQMLAAERNQRGGVAGAQAAAPAEADGAGSGKVVEAYPTGQLKWLSCEKLGNFVYGQEITNVAEALVKDAKAVYDAGDGVRLFVQCVDGGGRDSFLGQNTKGDSRVLPVQWNALGQPERTLKEVASLSREVEVKWSLPGPRTSQWCINYLSIEGLGFEGHHQRLRQMCRLEPTSWGVQEHFQVSMALRQALLVDQLDGCNLLSTEVQFRRLQTIEFSYAEKAKDAEARGAGGRLSLEEQVSFGGVTRQFSTLMICPSLLDHVKTETEKEAALAKSLRKAREEREAARKAAVPKKGAKGQQGGGDADP